MKKKGEKNVNRVYQQNHVLAGRIYFCPKPPMRADAQRGHMIY